MMAAHDSHATVRESVESVLAQTVPELELIVVDDGSQVPIADALSGIRDERLRVIRRERNRGPAVARNVALREARSEFVSQLDSDDLWHPDYLESVLPRFDDPDVGLVYANVRILRHPHGREIAIVNAPRHPVDYFPDICGPCPIPSPTVTVRREAIRGVGGYARWLRAAEDHHLYVKLARAGWRFDYVDRPLATYRYPTAESGMSHDLNRVRKQSLKMWIAFMLRHPLTPGPRRQVRVRLGYRLRRGSG